MAKFDLKRAYYAFPIRECDEYLLGMFWKNHYYVDLALPFGLSNAPNIFNRGADLLKWAIAVSDSFQRIISSIFMMISLKLVLVTLISVKILWIPVQRSVNF